MKLIEFFAFNPGNCSDVYDMALADAREHEFYFITALVIATAVIAALAVTLTLISIRYRRLKRAANSPRLQNKKS